MLKSLFARKQTVVKKQMDGYLYYCEFIRRLAPASIKSYRKDIAKFVIDSETKDLRRVTIDHLNTWQGLMAEEGKSGKTINNYRDAVVGCLKYLEKSGDKVNLNFALVERALEEQREAVHFTEDEVTQIKAACEGLRELLMISLLFDSGIRISELRALKIEHISGNKIQVVQGKGRKDRVTFMRDTTKGLLEQWLNVTGTRALYVFPSPVKSNVALSDQQIRGSINAPIRRAGFGKGSAHSLRHSMITSMINNEADIFTVQTLVGHSDPKVTRRYFHTNAEQLARKYARFAPGVVS